MGKFEKAQILGIALILWGILLFILTTFELFTSLMLIYWGIIFICIGIFLAFIGSIFKYRGYYRQQILSNICNSLISAFFILLLLFSIFILISYFLSGDSAKELIIIGIRVKKYIWSFVFLFIISGFAIYFYNKKQRFVYFIQLAEKVGFNPISPDTMESKIGERKVKIRISITDQRGKRDFDIFVKIKNPFNLILKIEKLDCDKNFFKMIFNTIMGKDIYRMAIELFLLLIDFIKKTEEIYEPLEEKLFSCFSGKENNLLLQSFKYYKVKGKSLNIIKNLYDFIRGKEVSLLFISHEIEQVEIRNSCFKFSFIKDFKNSERDFIFLKNLLNEIVVFLDRIEGET